MFSFVFCNVLIGGDIVFFDNFIDSQNVSYYLLKNSLLKGRISHAYLIDSNNNENAFDFALSFIKMLLCEHHYSFFSNEKCGECNLCSRIQDGNYSEIRIIESDTLVIKKEQLLELQDDFSKTSIEGKYRIYVIKDCDKMNKQASNSLLKFLEEPVDGIIAILLTSHFSRILSTIVSRCQVIHLNNNVILKNDSTLENLGYFCCNGQDDFEKFISDEKTKEILDATLKFIRYFENNGLDTLLFMKKLWYNKIQTRDDNLFAFKIMVYFYYDVLKFKINCDNYLFCDNIEDIEVVANYNDLDVIVEKLNIIQYGYEMLLCNLNVNLLLDDIVIKLGDVK